MIAQCPLLTSAGQVGGGFLGIVGVSSWGAENGGPHFTRLDLGLFCLSLGDAATRRKQPLGRRRRRQESLDGIRRHSGKISLSVLSRKALTPSFLPRKLDHATRRYLIYTGNNLQDLPPCNKIPTSHSVFFDHRNITNF